MKAVLLLQSSLSISLAYASDSSSNTARSIWTPGNSVKTSTGMIGGHAAANRSQVSEYLGIPYAQPPLGVLRFAPPVKYTGSTTINASAFGPGCLSTTQANGGSMNTGNSANLTAAGTAIVADIVEVGLPTSEDCLTLNVWTKPQTGESKKAVMVFVFGGSFTSGSAAIPLYNGQIIADEEDIVVVTFNYRLGIFGFPGATQNVGLLDQRLAIEWVRDNIANFGGDPSRITLVGQSAGSGSVDIYSYLWASDPIVSGFIMQSGNVLAATLLNTTAATAQFLNVSSAVGCGSAGSNVSTVLSCMQSANATTILKASASQMFTPRNDNETVFDKAGYGLRSLSGNYTKKPILVGNNDNEAPLFAVTAIIAGQDASQYEGQAGQAYNLLHFDCPAAARANISIYNHVPTWRYRWFGVFGNTNLTTYPDSGAYHGSELSILFGTPPAGPGIPANSAAEQAVMSYVRGAWVAFIKDPVKGLSTYGWPSYDPNSNTLVRLGLNGITGTDLASPSMYDSGCQNLFSSSGLVGNGTTPGNSSSVSNSAIGFSAMTKIKITLVAAAFVMNGWSWVI